MSHCTIPMKKWLSNPKRQTSHLPLGRREEGSCLFCFLTAAGLANLVECLTADLGGGGVLPYITYTGMCRPTGS